MAETAKKAVNYSEEMTAKVISDYQEGVDLDTIADLQKLPGMLGQRGYSEGDIEKIMSRNFLGMLRRAWA